MDRSIFDGHASERTLPGADPEFSTDAAAVQENIASMRVGGFTALIDTLYLGLNRMRHTQLAQRAIIVISDGADNHSRYARGELLRIALEADVHIYAIIVDNGVDRAGGNTLPYRPSQIRKSGDQASERAASNILEDLASKTGGLYFHVRNAEQARDGMAKAGQALRNQYVLGYRPDEAGLAGKWRRIRVTTVPKLNVHARSGYYAP